MADVAQQQIGHEGGETGHGGRHTCCVCMEPWTNTGAHRICCIPCGHVYGRSCLETWLSRGGSTSAKCPQCSKRFALEDIINLYAPTDLWDGYMCTRYHAPVPSVPSESETDFVIRLMRGPTPRLTGPSPAQQAARAGAARFRRTLQGARGSRRGTAQEVPPPASPPQVESESDSNSVME